MSTVEEQVIQQFLAFIGVGLKPKLPRPDWNINQLQYGGVFFGLSGEDIVLRSLFKQRLWRNEPGIYVDIGCARPGVISNTFYFYMIGWRGVCVDANPKFKDEWAAIRPHDIYVNAAVSDGAGPLYSLEHRSNMGASIIAGSPEPPSADFLPGKAVPTERMDSLLARTIGDKPIQFLSIDVEDTELSALRTNDWERWLPEVICIECHAFDFEAPYAAPSLAYLRERGYKLTAKVGATVLMALG